MNRSQICAFFCLAVFVAGCSLPGARKQAISHFVLETPPAASAPALPAHSARPVLLLHDAEPGGFAESLRLIYSRIPGTQAHYQYAYWHEAPRKRLQILLRQRLLTSGLYAGVVPLGAGVSGEYQLNFRLLDFFHDATQTPGMARVKLDVELVERGSARLIAQQVFVGQAPLSSQTAAAAAAALGQASGQTFDAVVTWLARVQPFPMEAVQAR